MAKGEIIWTGKVAFSGVVTFFGKVQPNDPTKKPFYKLAVQLDDEKTIKGHKFGALDVLVFSTHTHVVADMRGYRLQSGAWVANGKTPAQPGVMASANGVMAQIKKGKHERKVIYNLEIIARRTGLIDFEALPELPVDELFGASEETPELPDGPPVPAV